MPIDDRLRDKTIATTPVGNVAPRLTDGLISNTPDPIQPVGAGPGRPDFVSAVFAQQGVTQGSGGASVPRNSLRATNAGFAPVFEINPNSGTSQTTRLITAPFNEPFTDFDVVYQLFRTRSCSFTGSIDNGAGAAGDILTVTAISTGGPVPGIVIVGTGVTTGTYITAQLTGDPAGIGTYKLSVVQAATVASSTITSAAFVDEMFQNGGATQTYEVNYEDAPSTAITGIPAGRPRVTFDSGAQSKAYNYATADKSVLYLVSDKMTRPRLTADPLAIWTRVTLPSNLSGLPVNKYASSVFANRGWGNEFVTSGSSADPGSATSIGAVNTTPGGFTACIVPVAIRIYTAGGAATVVGLGDSRSSFTGLGQTTEPAGFGDTQGDLVGRGSGIERGIHGVAKQHSLMLAKPTDRAIYLAQSPLGWRGRRQIAQICGSSSATDKVVVNAYGQNDQNDTPVAWTSGMDLPIGRAITTSNRVYVVTVAGSSAAAVAPTSTTLNTDIALGTATIRYYGTDATATNRVGLAIAGKNYVINQALRAAMPGVTVTQEGLGPYSASTDNWLTAAGQSDGFNSVAGKTYLTQLAANGPSYAGADRVVSSMSLLGGSRTVDGGADDGSRTWGTPAPQVAYQLTPDGIHRNNKGAEIGKVAFTKLAVTGTP